MKTIGVIGGLGPQATMDFESRLHTLAQQRVPQDANQGYPPLVVYYHRFAPFLEAESWVPAEPLRPHPRLAEAAERIGPIVDFIVITCNYLHVFRREVEELSGREVLSMVDLTVAETQARGWRRVGLPAFREPTIYLDAVAGFELTPETLHGPLRDRVDAGITRVMEGRFGADDSAAAHEALAELRARPVDGIVLACTEIPFLLGPDDQGNDVLNPIQLLAEAALERAIS